MSEIIATIDYLLEIIKRSVAKIKTIRDESSGRVVGYVFEFPRRKRGELHSEASLAVIILIDVDVLHRHSQTIETYMVLYGSGAMAMGDDECLVMQMGDSFRVTPGTWHAAMPLNNRKLVFACVSEPTFDPDDFERHPTEATSWFNRRVEQVAPGFEG